MIFSIMFNRITFFTIILAVFASCKHDKADPIDKELYDMARIGNGFTWYKNSANSLEKSSGTGHNFDYLRTRFNTIAASGLDSNGKIKAGYTFPEGSLIVKDLEKKAGTVSRYAILYKKPGNANADAKGWVWGYIEADGDVAEPSANKGKSCINCHSQGGNIDYMLMNKFFP
jgi:hypothetical protein